MTSRPYDLMRRVPGVVAATLTGRRLRTSGDRNPAARHVYRRKKRHVQSPPTPANAGVAARAWAPLMGQRHDDGNSRREPGTAISETVSYVGRLVMFNLAVGIIHIAVVWWILLRIGA